MTNIEKLEKSIDKEFNTIYVTINSSFAICSVSNSFIKQVIVEDELILILFNNDTRVSFRPYQLEEVQYKTINSNYEELIIRIKW